MIDSAQAYNEEAVGEALKETVVPRQDIFLVSKVHPRFLGFEETIKSVEESLVKLKVRGHKSFLDCFATTHLLSACGRCALMLEFHLEEVCERCLIAGGVHLYKMSTWKRCMRGV